MERNSANGVYPFCIILIPISLISTSVSQMCTPLGGFQCVVRPVTSSSWFGQSDVIFDVCDAFNICSNDAGPRVVLTFLLLLEAASSWKKIHKSDMNYLLSKLLMVSRTDVTWDESLLKSSKELNNAIMVWMFSRILSTILNNAVWRSQSLTVTAEKFSKTDLSYFVANTVSADWHHCVLFEGSVIGIILDYFTVPLYSIGDRRITFMGVNGENADSEW